MTPFGDLFLARWSGVRASTLAFVAALPESILSFAPSPGYRSVEEMVRHLVAAEAAVIGGIDDGNFPWSDTKGVVAAIPWRDLPRAAAGFDGQLASIVTSESSDWLATPPPRSSLARHDWLWRLLEHEIHHRGQLSLMVRLAGVEPPALYE